MEYCKFCMSKIGEAQVCPVCGKDQTGVSVAHHLKPGTILHGKYLVGESLGDGGFGITYIGRDLDLDATVAIKEYYPTDIVGRVTGSFTVTPATEQATDTYEKGRVRFLGEARTLAHLRGEENIVTVYERFEENNTAYFVMEYLGNQSLKTELAKCGKMTPGQTLDLLRPVMKALDRVHRAGLIHRDISPDNIMLKDDRAVVVDFGAARETSGDKSMSVLYKKGYTPFEQFSRKGDQGPWTDVYAMSATIYRCITGEMPEFSVDRVTSDELKPPSAYGIDISPEFEAALLKGLSVFPKDRYKSMKELLDALEKANASSVRGAAGAAAAGAAGAAGTAKAAKPAEPATPGAEQAEPVKREAASAKQQAEPEKAAEPGAEQAEPVKREAKRGEEKTMFLGDAPGGEAPPAGGAKKEPPAPAKPAKEEKKAAPVDPDKTVYGGAQEPSKEKAAPVDPDKTVYGGDIGLVSDEHTEDAKKPKKRNTVKWFLICCAAAGLLIAASVFIVLYAIGVFDSAEQNVEETETTQSDASVKELEGVWNYEGFGVYMFGEDGSGYQYYEATGRYYPFSYSADGNELTIVYSSYETQEKLTYSISGDTLTLTKNGSAIELTHVVSIVGTWKNSNFGEYTFYSGNSGKLHYFADGEDYGFYYQAENGNLTLNYLSGSTQQMTYEISGSKLTLKKNGQTLSFEKQ